MAEQEKDRTEPATPFKLEEARKRGQVAKSLDFNSLFVIGALLASIYAWGDDVTRGGARLNGLAMERAVNVVGDVPALSQWLGELMIAMLVLVAPFFAAALIASVCANLFQAGPVFSGFPLKPDFQRLNPVEGLKRVFSLRMLFEGVKTVIKVALFGFVAYLAIDAAFPALLALSQSDPKSYMALMIAQVSVLAFKLFLCLVIVALLDLAYAKWDYARRMRMSRREMKEEIKRREGDPLVRARIRELQQETAKRAKSLKRVPEADVLITNPDHFAVAVRYDRETMRAPVVIAKGAGDLAQQMKAVAQRSNVPLFESPTLARRLFTESDLDMPVDSRLFEPLARVYAWLYAERQSGMRIEVAR